jgi:UDP-N-acetylglucosamine 3-dehydrogenase
LTTRIALIGCGTIARRSHLPAFKASPEAEVVAFASRSLSSAEAAAAEYGGGEVFDDWRKVLDCEIDAVDICSPNSSHAEQAIAAADAGKHVLVEKPIARTVEEADAMVQAAADNGVVLQVAHNMRYIPAIVAARAEVASGAIGPLVGARVAFGHSGPHDWAAEAAWFFDPELSGGGPLIDLGIHAIDFTRYVTQLDITEVSAMVHGDGAVEDAAHVLLRFSSGATGTLHSSWVTKPAPDLSLTLFGTNGTLHFDGRTPLHVRDASGEKRVVELPEVSSDPFVDFVRAIAGPTDAPSATGAEGRAALAVVCAAYEAARTGRAVQVA